MGGLGCFQLLACYNMPVQNLQMGHGSQYASSIAQLLGARVVVQLCKAIRNAKLRMHQIVEISLTQVLQEWQLLQTFENLVKAG